MNKEDIENEIKKQLGLSLSALPTGTAALDISQSPEKEKLKRSDVGKKKHSKATRRNSEPEISEHSRNLALEEISKHSDKSSVTGKSKKSSSRRRRSFTEIPNPLDKFFRHKSSDSNDKAKRSNSGHRGS